MEFDLKTSLFAAVLTIDDKEDNRGSSEEKGSVGQ